MGGGSFRIVAESSLEGGGGRRSGELPPWRMLFNGARAGILEGLFAPEASIIELASGLREMLAPKVEADTGVFARLGGGPRIVPARLMEPVLEAVTGFVGMPEFDGVFARGGATADAAAYNSSRYR